MFHKILVAIDYAEFSQQVFDQALTLARATSASLVLLNVLSLEDEIRLTPPMLSGYESYPIGLSSKAGELYQELWQTHAERSLEMLQTLTQQATTAGVDATLRQSLGSPGRIICELANELNVDLIILGRRGLSGLNELLLGSVSNYVLHHAPCSVLTVQSQIQKHPDVSQEKQTVIAS
jgi:nucleotide-binding universal stress UspA family protein